MAKETPVQAMKRLYGSKEKLIEQVVDVAKSAGEEASEVKDRLVAVSNQKLLRLAEVGKVIKDKYGSRDKLVVSLSSALGKAKDKDYVEKLKGYSPSRLLDMMKTVERKNRSSKSA
jgi:hypothetical protein